MGLSFTTLYVKIHTTVYTFDGGARIEEATVLDEE
jgi:hypothetical protein